MCIYFFKFIKFVLNLRVLFYFSVKKKKKALFANRAKGTLFRVTRSSSLYNFTTKRSFFLKPFICPQTSQKRNFSASPGFEDRYGLWRRQIIGISFYNKEAKAQEGSHNFLNVTQLVNDEQLFNVRLSVFKVDALFCNSMTSFCSPKFSTKILYLVFQRRRKFYDLQSFSGKEIDTH